MIYRVSPEKAHQGATHSRVRHTLPWPPDFHFQVGFGNNSELSSAPLEKYFTSKIHSLLPLNISSPPSQNQSGLIYSVVYIRVFHMYQKCSKTVSQDVNGFSYVLRATQKNSRVQAIFVVWPPFFAFTKKFLVKICKQTICALI